MADDVTIRMQLQNQARVSAGLQKAAADIEDVGDEADGAARDTRRLDREMDSLARGFAQLSASAGAASLALAGVGFAAQAASVGGGGGGGAAAGGGGLGGMGKVALYAGGAVAALLPVIVGTGGALTALAGSLTAAAAGFGAVGVAGGAAAAVGLGGVGLVAAQAAEGFKTVSTALDAYNVTVAQFGRDSDEARKAKEKLDAVVSQSGGAPILSAVKGYRALSSEFTRLTEATRGRLARGFAAAITGARKLLPVFTEATNRSSKALLSAFKVPLAAFTGREAQGALRTFGKTFADSVGPVVAGLTDIGRVLMRVAVAASPFVVQAARGFASLARSLAASTKDGGRLSGIVGGLVGHLKSWGGLLASVGRLVFTVFSSGAASGRGLVDSLTGVINKTTAWLQTAQGQESMRRFFADAVSFTRSLVVVLGQVVGAAFTFGRRALPTVTTGLEVLGTAFRVVMTVVRVWQGALDRVGLGMNAVSTAIGFVTRGLGGLVSTVRAMPGRIASAATGMWDGIKNAFRSAINWLIGKWNSLEFKVPSVDLGPLGSFGGTTIGVPDIPMLAQGGVIRSSGTVLVGERGPEMLSLPRAARVTPLPAPSLDGGSVVGGGVTEATAQRLLAFLEAAQHPVVVLDGDRVDRGAARAREGREARR